MPSVEMDCKADMAIEGLEEAIIQMLESDTLKPFKVVIDAPHATYVEFGTGPAEKKNGTPHVTRVIQVRGVNRRVERTEVFWRLYDWVEDKLGSRLKDPYAYACSLYTDTMENGMPPRPYVRPVLHELEQEFSKVLAETGSIEGVAEELAERIRDNLNAPRFPQSAETYTGDLENSIYVAPVEEGEDFTDDDIPASVWASDKCDYDGIERDRAWRKK